MSNLKHHIERNTQLIMSNLKHHIERNLTAEEMAHNLALRQTVLAEAIQIRRALGQARTAEDFRVCHDRADALGYISEKTISCNMDDFFLTDCMIYCRNAKLGHEDHRLAIKSIKHYMSAIRERIANPPTTVLVPK